MKDLMERELAVGDLVVVAKASGRSNATQVIGFIEKFSPNGGGRMTIRRVIPPRFSGGSWFVSVQIESRRIVKLDPDSFDWPEGWVREG